MTLRFTNLFVIILLLASAACSPTGADRTAAESSIEEPPLAEIGSESVRKVLESAYEQTRLTTNYSQEYFRLAYPNGDPPIETGACTDVVIRAFRNAGVDLQ